MAPLSGGITIFMVAAEGLKEELILKKLSGREFTGIWMSDSTRITSPVLKIVEGYNGAPIIRMPNSSLNLMFIWSTDQLLVALKDVISTCLANPAPHRNALIIVPKAELSHTMPWINNYVEKDAFPGMLVLSYVPTLVMPEQLYLLAR